MVTPRANRTWAGLPPLPVWLLWFLLLAACDRNTQEVRVAAQDYRFDPDLIRLAPDRPIRLTVVNEGRETHEFTASFFSDRSVTVQDLAAPLATDRGPAYRLPPGASLRVTFQAGPGIYSFSCRLRGHRGMTGTLMLEQTPPR